MLESLLRKRPGWSVLSYLTGAYEKQGRPLEDFIRLYERSSGFSTTEFQIDCKTRLFDYYMKARNYDAAVKMCPTHKPLLLIDAYLGAKNQMAAETLVVRMLQECAVGIGEIKQLVKSATAVFGDQGRVLDVCQTAVSGNSRSINHRFQLFLCYLQMGSLHLAEASLEKLCDIGSDFDAVLKILAYSEIFQIYWRKQDTGKARQIYRTMKGLLRKDIFYFEPKIGEKFGHVALTVGDFEEAAETFGNIMHNPGNQTFWRGLWKALNVKYGREIAIPEYQKLVAKWRFTGRGEFIPKWQDFIAGDCSLESLCN